VTAKVTGDPLGDIVPNIERAVNEAFSTFLVTTQGKLGKANPKDTGRMASSWFIGRNRPSSEVQPRTWAPKQSKRYVQVKFGGPITFGGGWYLTNNVPYANRVALDPVWAKNGGGGPNWYKSIVANMPADFRSELRETLRRLS
jgi:hypothetical protein